MKKIINEEGFKKAMKADKPWTTLDCQLSETEDGGWYYEIEKTVFHNKDGVTEFLGFGHGLESCENDWNNYIQMLKPDEYFVDQHNLA